MKNEIPYATIEKALRDSCRRGNEYMKVIRYAIDTLYNAGLRQESAYIVRTLNNANQQIEDIGNEKDSLREVYVSQKEILRCIRESSFSTAEFVRLRVATDAELLHKIMDAQKEERR